MERYVLKFTVALDVCLSLFLKASQLAKRTRLGGHRQTNMHLFRFKFIELYDGGGDCVRLIVRAQAAVQSIWHTPNGAPVRAFEKVASFWPAIKLVEARDLHKWSIRNSIYLIYNRRLAARLVA